MTKKHVREYSFNFDDAFQKLIEAKDWRAFAAMVKENKLEAKSARNEPETISSDIKDEPLDLSMIWGKFR